MDSNKISYFKEIAIEIPTSYTDAVCDFIIDNITNGLVMEDEEGNDKTVIKFYLSPDNNKDFRDKLNGYFNSLLEMQNGLTAIPEINEREVKNLEWEEEYKKSVKAVLIDGSVSVRPPWEDKPEGAVYDIIIEPKMAFGTGTHETTRSCLKIIKDHFKENMSFLDIGCGSGILSILTGKMKASYIKAVDYDPDAIENCHENFEINKIECKYDLVTGTIDACAGDKAYDFVCANIIKTTILEIIAGLDKLTADNGILALSGLLDQDTSDINKALAGLGLTKYSIYEDNEWRSYIIHKG